MLRNSFNQTQNYEVGFSVFVLSFLFSISQPQLPLFSSNQNGYLLHGVASAVGEPLISDWLANQTSNIKVFSWFTEVSYKIFPNIFYIYHMALAFIMILSLYMICAHFQPRLRQKTPTVLFFALISFLNLTKIPILSGIAGQYILGSVFQPSAFGVFLLASVAFFLLEKYIVAILCCVISAYFHPTYVLSAGLLVFTYQLVLIGRKNYQTALVIGLLAFLLIFPLVLSVYNSFGTSPSELSNAAQRILVFERIPHHALLSKFAVSLNTAFGLLMIGAAVFVGRDNLEFVKIMTVPFVLSLGIVLIAFFADNYFMMLLFGQRTSVWLVPISSAYIITRLCSEVEWGKVLNIKKWYLFLMSFIFMFSVGSFGLFKNFSNHVAHKSNPIFGVLSKLDYSEGVLLVPLGEQNIRLNAQVPIFIDWKAHPYKSEQVIEWYDRVNLVRDFYESDNAEKRLSSLNMIRAKESIRFILSDVDKPIRGCRPIYEGDDSIVYDVRYCSFE